MCLLSNNVSFVNTIKAAEGYAENKITHNYRLILSCITYLIGKPVLLHPVHAHAIFTEDDQAASGDSHVGRTKVQTSKIFAFRMRNIFVEFCKKSYLSSLINMGKTSSF